MALTEEELIQILEDDLGCMPFDAAQATQVWAPLIQVPRATIYAVLGVWDSTAFLGDNHGQVVEGAIVERGAAAPAMYIHRARPKPWLEPWHLLRPTRYKTDAPLWFELDLTDCEAWRKLDTGVWEAEQDWWTIDEPPEELLFQTITRYTVQPKTWGKVVRRPHPPEPILNRETGKLVYPPPAMYYGAVHLPVGFCPELGEWVVWGEPYLT